MCAAAKAPSSSPCRSCPIAAEEGRLRLYGRAWCHLCEDMAAGLRTHGLAFDEYDVDSDPGLEARWGERVPVLTDAGGREICHYFLDDEALRRCGAIK